jgi:DNA-directed RNA polymerase specialized sigma24 family protein
MSEITTLLRAASGGDRQAADRAYALLYADLHRVAHSRLRREGEFTLLDTTALVHESYLRLRSGTSWPMQRG